MYSSLFRICQKYKLTTEQKKQFILSVVTLLRTYSMYVICLLPMFIAMKFLKTHLAAEIKLCYGQLFNRLKMRIYLWSRYGTNV